MFNTRELEFKRVNILNIPMYDVSTWRGGTRCLRFARIGKNMERCLVAGALLFLGVLVYFLLSDSKFFGDVSCQAKL